jgi:Sec-independent protein translocase protein TatA
MNKIKILSLLLIIILVANIILFGTGMMPQLYFWIIIAITALFAYKILPKIKA